MRRIKVLTFIGIALVLLSSNKNFGQVPNFGTATNFALYTIAGNITNSATSQLSGDIGTNNGAISGFGSSDFTGNMYVADAVTAQFSSDLLSAYNHLNNTPATNTIHTPAFGNGEVLSGGVYSIEGAGSLAGMLTLDAQGDSNTIFIFKMAGAFTTGASSSVILTQGALSSRVFWITDGAISMAALTAMKGTLISHNGAASMGDCSTLEGRLYSTSGAIAIYGVSVSIAPFPIMPLNMAPNLGTISNYVLFTIGGAVSNTGSSWITGNIGTNVGAINGFETSIVKGAIHNANAATAQCSTDLRTAYDQLNGTEITAMHGNVMGNGETLYPGVYDIASAGSVSGSIILDGQGDSNAVFIVKVGGAFSAAAATSVVLTNNTTSCNVFWLANGAISIGASSNMKGTFIANNGAVSMAAGGSLEGRIFSTTGAVAIDAVTISVTIGCAKSTIWTGAVSRDWFTTDNWFYYELPTKKVNVKIPAGLINYPVLDSGIGYVHSITIEKYASLKVSTAKLKISGIINNKGALDLGGGTIEMDGNKLQTIAANTFAHNNLLNLIVSNNVRFEGQQNLTGALSFGSSNNTLFTNGFLTLQSTALRTARIADITHPINDPITIISGNKFVGNTTVERYYPARRAWRLATVPLSGAGSVFSTWQNGGIDSPGRGTYVTGTAANSHTNGLDASPANNTSLRIGTGLIAVGNTLTTTLSNSTDNFNHNGDNKAFFIFVRGDRIPSNFDVPNSSSTTLSGSGKLQTGDIKFDFLATDPVYNMVGNPYASPVDFIKLNKVNLCDAFYVWDPYLNEEKGGYVAMIGDMKDNSTSFAQSPLSPGGQTTIIHSGQALYVCKANPVESASLNFSESVKSIAVLNANGMFRPMNNQQSFRANLYLLKTDSTTILADGNLIQFDTRFDADVNNMDGIKFFNSYETFGVLSGSTALSINRRPPLNDQDTIFFSLVKSRQLKYQFEFIPANLNPSLLAVLEDSYTGIRSPLSMLGRSTVNFTVDANAASQTASRFRIVFAASKVLPVTYACVVAFQKNNEIAVEWKVENELNISRYEVEKSTNGYNFTKVNTVVAASVNGSATYTWYDSNAVKDINFYRIKNINLNGSVSYSPVVKIDLGKMASSISIYPNPVLNGVISLQLVNQAEGKYILQLTNKLGQIILSKSIIHSNASPLVIVTANKIVAKGVYSLAVIKPDKSNTTIKVLFQ